MRLVERALRRIRQAAALKVLYAAAMLACAVMAAASGAWREAAPHPSRMHEWPTQWDGRALQPLALRDVEQRFAARFPGVITRMTDGRQQLVMRHVEQPTRMLHPAADCYRGVGFRIDADRLESDARQRRWRCFEAARDGQRLRVCERIVDADGAAFTDVSSWYWAALLGQSHGPWQAITTAQAM